MKFPTVGVLLSVNAGYIQKVEAMYHMEKIRKGGFYMPKWLHNTLFILIQVVTMGCVAHGLEWKK